MQTKTRAFLKWAGGKYSLVEDISARLDVASKHADTLVEPFVGAGSVFLNTHFKHYILNDINADLINLYNELKNSPDEFISDAKKLFVRIAATLFRDIVVEVACNHWDAPPGCDWRAPLHIDHEQPGFCPRPVLHRLCPQLLKAFHAGR